FAVDTAAAANFAGARSYGFLPFVWAVVSWLDRRSAEASGRDDRELSPALPLQAPRSNSLRERASARDGDTTLPPLSCPAVMTLSWASRTSGFAPTVIFFKAARLVALTLAVD
ncbi:unnamed protein product, partial [Ascophyllum nodosum]